MEASIEVRRSFHGSSFASVEVGGTSVHSNFYGSDKFSNLLPFSMAKVNLLPWNSVEASMNVGLIPWK